MNFQPIPIESVPLGRPLPWRIYDRNGYIVFARGEIISSRDQLETLLPGGLFHDIDAPPQNQETGDWAGFSETAAIGVFPPHGIKPQIGDVVQLLLPNQIPHRYYTTHLIGQIKNQSVLLSRPAGFAPPEGDLVEVRMVTGSHIYAFRSSIQRFCTSPAPYMHLDFPLEVRVQKLRKSPWARVNLGVTITDAQGGHEAARLVNLSADGGLLHAFNIGNPGDKLRLSMHVGVDELKSTLNLDATILHINPNAQNIEANLLEYALRFEDVSSGDALWLKALVYRHIAFGDAA